MSCMESQDFPIWNPISHSYKDGLMFAGNLFEGGPINIAKGLALARVLLAGLETQRGWRDASAKGTATGIRLGILNLNPGMKLC